MNISHDSISLKPSEEQLEHFDALKNFVSASKNHSLSSLSSIYSIIRNVLTRVFFKNSEQAKSYHENLQKAKDAIHSLYGEEAGKAFEGHIFWHRAFQIDITHATLQDFDKKFGHHDVIHLSTISEDTATTTSLLTKILRGKAIYCLEKTFQEEESNEMNHLGFDDITRILNKLPKDITHALPKDSDNFTKAFYIKNLLMKEMASAKSKEELNSKFIEFATTHSVALQINVSKKSEEQPVNLQATNTSSSTTLFPGTLGYKIYKLLFPNGKPLETKNFTDAVQKACDDILLHME